MNDSTSQNQRDRNSKRWQIITVAGILAVLGAGLWAWNSSQGTATAAPAPAATAHHKHHHKAGQQITVVPAAPAPAQAQPAAPAAPAQGLRYVGDGIYAGPNTSDAFARNVVSAWTGTPGVAYVYSPVTGQTYTMTCEVVGAGTVIATGGNGAYVQF